VGSGRKGVRERMRGDQKKPPSTGERIRHSSLTLVIPSPASLEAVAGPIPGTCVRSPEISEFFHVSMVSVDTFDLFGWNPSAAEEEDCVNAQSSESERGKSD
jgi:hypothetical protein